jgi:HK97 family phage prohead protease
MNKLFANTIVKVSKDEDRVIEFTASEEIVDYDGDLVKIEGMDISKIKKNKSFLWSHGHKDLPVVKVISVKKDKGILTGKAQLTSEEEYPFGYQVYKLIKGGYINNVSISFMPDYSTAEYRDIKGKSVRVINNSTLLEISAVNIGANSNALITGYKSLKEATNKAWDDGVLDGEELNSVNDMIEALNTNIEKDIEELDTDDNIYDYLFKDFDKKEDKDVIYDELLNKLALK